MPLAERGRRLFANKPFGMLMTLGFVVLLNGCGGGGGGSEPTPPMPAPPSSTTDTTPDAFAFDARVDVAQGSVVESNAINVAGINAAASISVSGGEYSINGGDFTATAGTVSAGDSVRVRLTASSTAQTALSATLSIGGVEGSFSVTTAGDPAPAGDSTRVVMLTSRLPQSQGSLTEAVAREQFERSKALIERLSYGAHTLVLDSVHDLGMTEFSRSDLTAWSATSGLLVRVLQAEGRDPYADNCDLAVEGPKAQALLDGLSEEDKAREGILIDTIDLGFAQTLTENRCRDFSPGGILATRIAMPDSIDYTKVDQIVYAPYDEVVHAGGYNISLAFSDVRKPQSMSDADFSRIEFVMSGAVGSALTTPIVVDSEGVGEAVSSENYLPDAPYRQTEFSRITTHEIVHGLGIGTHDNGIEAAMPGSDAALVNRDPIAGASAHNLEYGDGFSLMGRSPYAIGVSPAVKEHLGWLPAARMHVITSGDGGQTYTLVPHANTEGVVAAKVRAFGERGFIYLSYESNLDEYRTLNHPGLFDNAQGAILRFAQNNGEGALTTSILLDPDGQPANHDYALKAGETFAIGGVSITVDTVSNEALSFRVSYQ